MNTPSNTRPTWAGRRRFTEQGYEVPIEHDAIGRCRSQSAPRSPVWGCPIRPARRRRGHETTALDCPPGRRTYGQRSARGCQLDRWQHGDIPGSVAELGFDVMRLTRQWAGSDLMAGDPTPSTSGLVIVWDALSPTDTTGTPPTAHSSDESA